MIGYYVHHVGQGHLDRARAIAEHVARPITVLSSLPRPASWPHAWLELPRDDGGAVASDPTAGGVLHWAPRHHHGLQRRMAGLAGWIADNDPVAFVSDLSVEVTALARLMGVPVVTIALPGRRDDPAHQLGYELADAVIAPWPHLRPGMCAGLERHGAKVHHVGGLSRFDGRPRAGRPGAGRRALLFTGAGGDRAADLDAPATPGWEWTRCGPGQWVEDPWPELCRSDVVVTHGGLGALSDVAAARRPAVVLPEPRPHDEQLHTARALDAAGLAVVLHRRPGAGEWPDILAHATRRGGADWIAWSDGHAAERAAAVIEAVAAR